MVSLLVLGAGGHAKVVADTALTSGFATSLAFLDDRYDSRLDSQTFLGFNIVGSLDDSLHDNLFSNYSHAAVAIGNNRLRLSWIRKLEHKGYSLPTLIHPSLLFLDLLLSHLALSSFLRPLCKQMLLLVRV